MSPALGNFRNALLFILGIAGGALLGSLVSLILDLPDSLATWSPLGVLGIAMIYAGFGAVPALLFASPTIHVLKRKDYSRWPAAAVLTVGGAIVGACLMFITFGDFQGFGSFERLGATAGASIGFALGLLLFPRARAVTS